MQWLLTEYCRKLANSLPARLHGAAKKKTVFITLFLCVLVSLIIETAQAWMPSRSSSQLDLICNAAGSGIGIFMAWWVFEKEWDGIRERLKAKGQRWKGMGKGERLKVKGQKRRSWEYVKFRGRGKIRRWEVAKVGRWDGSRGATDDGWWRTDVRGGLDAGRVEDERMGGNAKLQMHSFIELTMIILIFSLVSRNDWLSVFEINCPG